MSVQTKIFYCQKVKSFNCKLAPHHFKSYQKIYVSENLNLKNNRKINYQL